jgi:hypothetical protein
MYEDAHLEMAYEDRFEMDGPEEELYCPDDEYQDEREDDIEERARDLCKLDCQMWLNLGPQGQQRYIDQARAEFDAADQEDMAERRHFDMCDPGHQYDVRGFSDFDPPEPWD